MAHGMRWRWHVSVHTHIRRRSATGLGPSDKRDKRGVQQHCRKAGESLSIMCTIHVVNSPEQYNMYGMAIIPMPQLHLMSVMTASHREINRLPPPGTPVPPIVLRHLRYVVSPSQFFDRPTRALR